MVSHRTGTSSTTSSTITTCRACPSAGLRSRSCFILPPLKPTRSDEPIGALMLRKEQNDLLTQTGPKTPMGAMFRSYWIPALLSEELPANDCAPVRVKLLSESLLAFRDSDGRYGLISEFCAHRGVSLWFGRNEEGVIRCAYHGWKYDVTGQCIDVPSEPAENGFCKRVKLNGYPLVEQGGVLWTYMGPPEKRPPLPQFEFSLVPSSHVYISKRWQ